ncbi:MAG: response regulator [Candidatus Hydrogenedentes bacterium]|nr:response regulator [Candidatus Hydrogenedentota bacterium]
MNASLAHCFIVDDDLSFGRSLKRLLNAEGVSADYFGSAKSFLDSVHPGQPGYAIVDIHMPGLDGFWLMNKMRDLRYVMPVIIITGQTGADTRDLALENGAMGFLQKPFDGESLLELMRRHADEGDRQAAKEEE